jgi:hypothetical protein
MKSSDRTIILILPAIALVIAFWILVLGPKKSESADLESQAADLQSSLAIAQAEIESGQDARDSFHRDYADLVELGAAAPADDEQATLVYDMSKLGSDNNVHFRSFRVTPATGDAVAPPVDPAAPTEGTVAALPLGAAVGPAGLPVMPYSFNYLGNFFDFADFFGDLDDQVDVSDDGSGPEVSGRLLTVDGFALTANPKLGFPDVQADLAVTSYIVPDDQGVDAGATPAGPGATPAPSTAAPATVPTTAPATVPTAGVTP